MGDGRGGLGWAGVEKVGESGEGRTKENRTCARLTSLRTSVSNVICDLRCFGLYELIMEINGFLLF
jgi:hypothetical protein